MVRLYGDENRYWLGASYRSANLNYAYWGIYYVYASGFVDGNSACNSFGYVGAPSYGVRPVISLQSDIQLEANSSNTYDIK